MMEIETVPARHFDNVVASSAAASPGPILLLLLQICCSASTVCVDVSVTSVRLQPPVDHAGHLGAVLRSCNRCGQLACLCQNHLLTGNSNRGLQPDETAGCLPQQADGLSVKRRLAACHSAGPRGRSSCVMIELTLMPW